MLSLPARRIVKPPIWDLALNAHECAPEWRWAWQPNVLHVPMVESAGTPHAYQPGGSRVSSVQNGDPSWGYGDRGLMVQYTGGPGHHFAHDDLPLWFPGVSAHPFTMLALMTITQHIPGRVHNTLQKDSESGPPYFLWVHDDLSVRANLNGAVTLISESKVSVGRIHLIGSRWDGSVANLVVDGKLEAPTPTSLVTNSGPWNIGTRRAGGGDIDRSLYGDVYAVYTFGWPLTEKELRQLVEDPFGPYRKSRVVFAGVQLSGAVVSASAGVDAQVEASALAVVGSQVSANASVAVGATVIADAVKDVPGAASGVLEASSTATAFRTRVGFVRIDAELSVEVGGRSERPGVGTISAEIETVASPKLYVGGATVVTGEASVDGTAITGSPVLGAASVEAQGWAAVLGVADRQARSSEQVEVTANAIPTRYALVSALATGEVTVLATGAKSVRYTASVVGTADVQAVPLRIAKGAVVVQIEADASAEAQIGMGVEASAGVLVDGSVSGSGSVRRVGSGIGAIETVTAAVAEVGAEELGSAVVEGAATTQSTTVVVRAGSALVLLGSSVQAFATTAREGASSATAASAVVVSAGMDVPASATVASASESAAAGANLAQAGVSAEVEVQVQSFATLNLGASGTVYGAITATGLGGRAIGGDALVTAESSAFLTIILFVPLPDRNKAILGGRQTSYRLARHTSDKVPSRNTTG